MGRTPVQRIILKCPNRATFSEANSGSEQAKGPNLRNNWRLIQRMLQSYVGGSIFSRSWDWDFFFFFSPLPPNLSGAHSASYPLARGAFYAGVKRPRRGTDHSQPSSVEVKNAWNYISTPPYIFMAWCLINHDVVLG
jgi:hypothetical protein